MPRSRGRKPKKSIGPRRMSPHRSSVTTAAKEMSVGAYRIRPARTSEELSGFERWASMAGAGGPKVAAHLVHAHEDGFLGAALRDPDSSHRMLLSAVMNRDLDAVVWGRTAALVAVLDEEVVGGVLVGPAAQFIADLAEAHDLGSGPVMRALLMTSKLHLVAVDEEHRKHGLGRALVDAATSLAYRGGAEILYGQFLTEDQGLADFYSRLGFIVMPPATPLSFARWLDGFPGGPAPLANETFFYRTMTTDGY